MHLQVNGQGRLGLSKFNRMTKPSQLAHVRKQVSRLRRKRLVLVSPGTLVSGLTAVMLPNQC